MMKKGKLQTPVRHALRETSRLLPKVKDGLGALKHDHREALEATLRSEFSDSLDIDDHLRDDHPQEHRWDYLLGHEPTQYLVGVESHSAKDDQIGNVIAKRQAALQQLSGHLADGARVGKWLWVASGNVHFADTEKARRRLDQAGVEFVGKRILAKHLPQAPPSRPPGNGSNKRGRR